MRIAQNGIVYSYVCEIINFQETDYLADCLSSQLEFTLAYKASYNMHSMKCLVY